MERKSGLTEHTDERRAAVVQVLAGALHIVTSVALGQFSSSRVSDGTGDDASGGSKESHGGEDELGEEHGDGWMAESW